MPFLRDEFLFFDIFTDFRPRRMKQLSPEEYTTRASRFLRKIVSGLSSRVEQLNKLYFKFIFQNPEDWGYNVHCFAEDSEESIRPFVEAEFARERSL